MIDGWGISREIALIWMSLDFTDDQSTLVRVMAWCRQATSHYLSQCWPRSLSPYGVTKPQWVKISCEKCQPICPQCVLFSLDPVCRRSSCVHLEWLVGLLRCSGIHCGLDHHHRWLGKHLRLRDWAQGSSHCHYICRPRNQPPRFVCK